MLPFDMHLIQFSELRADPQRVCLSVQASFQSPCKGLLKNEQVWKVILIILGIEGQYAITICLGETSDQKIGQDTLSEFDDGLAFWTDRFDHFSAVLTMIFSPF